MSRKTELIALLLADGVAFGAAFLLQFQAYLNGNGILFPLFVLNAYWIVLLAFSGMYRTFFAGSRFDEVASLLKMITVGILVLVFVFYVGAFQARVPRDAVLLYAGSVFVFTASGRLVIRSIQKALLVRGRGVRRALIVGWSDRVEQLYDDVARYPAAGLKVVGALRMNRVDEWEETAGHHGNFIPGTKQGDGVDVLTIVQPSRGTYTVEALPGLIDELGVQDVLIALGSEDHQALMRVLHLCDGKSVSLKLVPDFYTVLGGMARTEHMYGLPLIEVLPEPMPAWQQSTKRLIDVLVSAVVLLAGLPVWMLIALIVRCSSPGPVIYRQQRVGQHGRIFTIYKFRTMRDGAELLTGPVWAVEDDTRYIPVGRWLRKTRLDEVPQFWNVLKGDMSLVGPRPERPYFVERLAEEIPLYLRRHRVKPGITGWAQVKWKYDDSVEDVRQKVKYDLFYIENMSLRMDFQILLTTLRIAFSGNGR